MLSKDGFSDHASLPASPPASDDEHTSFHSCLESVSNTSKPDNGDSEVNGSFKTSLSETLTQNEDQPADQTSVLEPVQDNAIVLRNDDQHTLGTLDTLVLPDQWDWRETESCPGAFNRESGFSIASCDCDSLDEDIHCGMEVYEHLAFATQVVMTNDECDTPSEDAVEQEDSVQKSSDSSDNGLVSGDDEGKQSDVAVENIAASEQSSRVVRQVDSTITIAFDRIEPQIENVDDARNELDKGEIYGLPDKRTDGEERALTGQFSSKVVLDINDSFWNDVEVQLETIGEQTNTHNDQRRILQTDDSDPPLIILSESESQSETSTNTAVQIPSQLEEEEVESDVTQEDEEEQQDVETLEEDSVAAANSQLDDDGSEQKIADPLELHLDTDFDYLEFLDKSVALLKPGAQSIDADSDERSPGLPPGLADPTVSESHSPTHPQPSQETTSSSVEAESGTKCTAIEAKTDALATASSLIDNKGGTSRLGEEQSDQNDHSACTEVTLLASTNALRWKLKLETYTNLLATYFPDCEAALSPKERRLIDKKVKLRITQISRSYRKVNQTAEEILSLLSSGNSDNERLFCMSRLARHIVNRCFTVNEELAVPLAHFCRKISQRYPEILKIVLAHLHKACPLLVPMYWKHDRKSLKERQEYQRKMQYLQQIELREQIEEAEDRHLEQQAGLVYFHACLFVTGEDDNFYGLASGWSYLARYLNHLPADRTTILFLYYFLKTCGYAMYRRYKGQFLKILVFVENTFLKRMVQSEEKAFCSSALSRLNTYITTKAYLQMPPSLQMPQIAESLTLHA